MARGRAFCVADESLTFGAAHAAVAGSGGASGLGGVVSSLTGHLAAPSWHAIGGEEPHLAGVIVGSRKRV